MLKENFVAYFESSIKKNWDLNALSDYNGEDYTYAETAKQILYLHLIFKNAGIKKGDKIGLIGKNSARWGITYIAVVTYGAVIVPILPDFKPDDVHNIVNHSDSVLLFAGDAVFELLDANKMTQVMGIISVNSFKLVHTSSKEFESVLKNAGSKFAEIYKDGITPENIHFDNIPNSDLAVISYTSGTTGFSKGVMLPHNSLAANIRFAHHHMPLNPGDPIVSFLPLAHTYGCAFEFLFPYTLGCHVTFLTKTPSPKIITQAFKEIKPALILSVPLVIEKIYKNQLLPEISKWHMKLLLVIPGIKKIILGKIKEKLTEVFGGNFREVVIGGAPFNNEAEIFFRKLKFPFTVGYGMTECGPLISYTGWEKNKTGSSGKPVDTLEVRIDSGDPVKEVGEIILRGENVMLGYYKNEEATREILDEEGWLHTGDLGLIDKEGNVYIKGRSKSLILGANGKNIYPDEIESMINNRFCVSESIVVQRGEKLVALINPDSETIEKANVSEEELQRIMEQHKKDLNDHLPAYMNVSKFEIHPMEFEKTPKRSIKRFMYQ